MGIRSRTKNFDISGGILTTDFILNLQEEEPKQPLIKPNTFSIPPNLVIKNQNQLDDLIKEAWERLLEKWDQISVRLKSMNESDSRQQWTIPFLKSLGFIDIQYSRKDISFEDDKIHVFISHRGWARADAPKIHIVGPNQELDKRQDTDQNKKSPHDSLQLYLNLDKSHMKWGIVTNGLQIRLLRDFFHTHTRGYMEFDVESILYERNFTDFRTLYRLIHTSRFIKDEENKTVLDRYYEKSVAAGSKIGEGLRENVKKAIELIGNGLLTHELRDSMIANEIIVKDFYQEILRVIYRILFLMFAEQRGMLPMHNSLYVKEYSITKLRERAETRIVSDNHFDLWHGLFSTFSLIREGSEELDVFGYNGDLYDDSNLKHILELNCRNDFLLRAIKYLTLYEKGKVQQRINFLDLGVEEIGAIYESLLDYAPRVLKQDENLNGTLYRRGEFILDPRGIGRKTTGSYYTDIRLINELVKSSLNPIVDDISNNSILEIEEKESKLLKLKICDPACGSGAFLIAANNHLGRILARLRSGNEYPTENTERIARRDVLRHCIYGVDLNPMAVELAKVSLWINASVKDLPLNYLDHHLKCGNSLIGTKKQALSKGIPDHAFSIIDGEEKSIANNLKIINNKQKKHKYTLDAILSPPKEISIAEYTKFSYILENSKEQVDLKKNEYEKLSENENFIIQKKVYDYWTSAFFWPFVEKYKNGVTEGLIQLIKEGKVENIENKISEKNKQLIENYSFFHWELEFPEVFVEDSYGFDCIITNPPWDKIRIEKREYFKEKVPIIAKARNAKERDKLINNIIEENSDIAKKYIKAQTESQKIRHFLRNSGFYSNSAKGPINTYAVFTERILDILSKKGRAGVILPTGFAMDFHTQEFFQKLVADQSIVSLYDFINSKRIFTDVHSSYKFSLLTIGGEEIQNTSSNYAFFLESPEEIQDETRIFDLKKEDIELLNPNSLTCPIFFSTKDFEISKEIYSKYPVICNKRNPLMPNFQMKRMFEMYDDAGLYLNYNEIKNLRKRDNSCIYLQNDEEIYPVYEAKMIWMYDHRFASFEDCSSEEIRKGHTKQFNEKKSDVNYTITPRYWISKNNFAVKKNNWGWDKKWFLVFRNITSAKNWRTCIATIIPDYPNVLTLFQIIGISAQEALYLVSIMNSFVFDYFTRLKVGGTHLNQFIVEQLPIIPFEKWNLYFDIMKPKLLELIYTSRELSPFAKECNYEGQPFRWDEQRRFVLKAEIDAIIALLFNISRDKLEYIMDTFPIQKQKDIKKYQDYRTKELILKYYNKYKVVLQEEKD